MKKMKISLTFNILIFALVVLSTVFMLNGFQFMKSTFTLSETGLSAFKFFTVDSNILVAIAALILIYYEVLVLTKKKEEVPRSVYFLKFTATVSVTLTFLTTVFFLAPIAKDGYFSLFENSNLFFHLIVPIISVISFIFFEKTDKLYFKYTLFSLVPMIIYSLFYSFNIFTHLENGKVSFKYDWYYFLSNGANTAFLVVIIMFAVTYLISFVLWKLNKSK